MTVVASLFDDPLAGWANDDLLFADSTRAHFAALAPAALPVFDWPELRDSFARHDAVANAARRASRTGGTRAATLGFAGLVIAALTPLIVGIGDTPLSRALGVAVAGLATVAAVWGWAQLLTGRRKREWLSRRFLTERLRQMHFQFALANFDLAVATMQDPARLTEWQARRVTALAAFELNIAAPLTASYAAMLDDIAEEAFWIDPAWRSRAALPEPSPERELLFATLANQRFEIQRRFSSLKLMSGFHSVASRARFIRQVSDILTVVVLLATAMGGVLLATGGLLDGVAVRAMTATLALATAAIAGMRVFNEGLQLTSEAERYRWYHAAVTALARRFGDAEPAGQIELLRDMERLSYQEMRWFLAAFEESRFVF
jgi:hypothetical protein